MEQLILRPLLLPTAEFLAYYLFHRKRLGIPGYRDYKTIGNKLNVALAAIDECLDLNGSSISTPQGAKQQLNEISEHVGEAIGLGVANRIHNLTEADWDPIDQQRGRKASPTFDFQVASTGRNRVQEIYSPEPDFRRHFRITEVQCAPLLNVDPVKAR